MNPINRNFNVPAIVEVEVSRTANFETPCANQDRLGVENSSQLNALPRRSRDSGLMTLREFRTRAAEKGESVPSHDYANFFLKKSAVAPGEKRKTYFEKIKNSKIDVGQQEKFALKTEVFVKEKNIPRRNLEIEEVKAGGVKKNNAPQINSETSLKMRLDAGKDRKMRVLAKKYERTEPNVIRSLSFRKPTLKQTKAFNLEKNRKQELYDAAHPSAPLSFFENLKNGFFRAAEKLDIAAAIPYSTTRDVTLNRAYEKIDNKYPTTWFSKKKE